MMDKNSTLHGAVKSLGLVFGDIGTSPIYTLYASQFTGRS
ncbi:MAG: KUP/HAK/KT family potassium transporter [Deltaproteobacteria bacterium]|nr:KUP/HAK/KT family potassium transporter [Deltaproteobacteria bacterium]